MVILTVIGGMLLHDAVAWRSKVVARRRLSEPQRKA
jgi:hypothetical protein